MHLQSARILLVLPKCQIIRLFFSFSHYCDSNIGLFFIAPSSVIALDILCLFLVYSWKSDIGSNVEKKPRTNIQNLYKKQSKSLMATTFAINKFMGSNREKSNIAIAIWKEKKRTF